MKLTIHTLDGGHVSIADFDPAGALDLREDVETGGWLTFDLDDGDTTIINAGHVTRIDFDETPKPRWWQRLGGSDE